MQKVSKQSLAMLALSILLAISIALTFTFAGLADSKTATGTIQFSGEASIAWASTNSGEGMDTKYVVADGAITIKLTNADFDFIGNTAKLKQDVINNEFSKVNVTITNGSTATLVYTIKMTTTLTGGDVAFAGVTDDTEITNTSAKKTLKDLVTAITITDTTTFTNGTFEITAAIGPRAE